MVAMGGWWYTTERLVMTLSFTELAQTFISSCSYLIHDEYLEDTKRQCHFEFEILSTKTVTAHNKAVIVGIIMPWPFLLQCYTDFQNYR